MNLPDTDWAKITCWHCYGVGEVVSYVVIKCRKCGGTGKSNASASSTSPA